MNDIWETAWASLNETFRTIATVVAGARPQMTWDCGHSDNESFAFRAYASFGRDVDNLEDVVISVDFLRAGDELHFSSDVATGDGEFLAHGPHGVIAERLETDMTRSQVLRVMSDIETFATGTASLIVRELDRTRD